MKFTYDDCGCLTTAPSLFTLPNQSWTLPKGATAASNKPENFNVGYFYPADPTWPLIDYRLNDCWGNFAVDVRDPSNT